MLLTIASMHVALFKSAMGGARRSNIVSDSHNIVGLNNNNCTSGAPDLYNMILQNHLMMQQMMFGKSFATNCRSETHAISDDEEERLVDQNSSHNIDELEQLCASADSLGGEKDSLKSSNTNDSEILESLKDFLCPGEISGPKIGDDLAKVIDNGMRSKVADD